MKKAKRLKERFKALDNSFVYIILGIVMAFGINWTLALALNTDMPVVAVESNSMVPTFSKGDILVLQGVPAEKLKVGDIIVFSPSPEQTPVVHRIVEINPDGTFQTKGDNNPGQLPFEKRIEASQIHGKTILIIPYLGWLKVGLTQYVLPNLVFFVFFGAIIVFIYLGVKFYRGSVF
ncbi:MAG: signal peptidase I [Candidatus Aenigmatarchaeota archaeon]